MPSAHPLSSASSTSVTFWLPVDLKRKLEKLAVRLGKKQKELLTEAIRQYLTTNKSGTK